MRRVSFFLTTLVLAALLLAACGEEQPTNIPNINVPPATIESTSTSMAAEAPTEAATEAPTEANMTSTPSVPVTGGNRNSQSITSMIGFPVCGLAGDQLGTVQDLVLDFNQSTVTYVIVDANGKSVAVPYAFLAKPRAGGTGTGTGTGAQATGTPAAGGTGTQVTDTPSAGTASATDTPSPGGAVSTATSTTGTGTGSGSSSGAGATSQQNCLTLTVGNDVFNGVPAFDPTAMPGIGQSSADWDVAIMPYWVGGVEDIATNTPEPTSTSTPSASGATSATATTSPSSSGTGSDTSETLQQIQGVVLMSKLLNSNVVISPQGAGTGTGTGTGSSITDSSQGTVQDVIIDPRIGKLQYLVVSFAADTWIPIPFSLVGWDATNNQVALMTNANMLQNAPTFSAGQGPATSTADWDQQFSSFWTGGGTGTDSGGTTGVTATSTP